MQFLRKKFLEAMENFPAAIGQNVGKLFLGVQDLAVLGCHNLKQKSSLYSHLGIALRSRCIRPLEKEKKSLTRRASTVSLQNFRQWTFAHGFFQLGEQAIESPKRVVFCHILMHLITEMNTKKCRSQLLNFIKKPLSNLPSFCYVAVSTPFFVFPIEAVSTIVSTIIFTMPRFMAGNSAGPAELCLGVGLSDVRRRWLREAAPRVEDTCRSCRFVEIL